MNILVIGSGGREHALCWALLQQNLHPPRRAPGALNLFCAPGNAGIAQTARCVPIQATDVAALAGFAEAEKIDLTIVGSEAPLAAGLVDEFERRKLLVAGPRREAARLESSKAFAKDFMWRHRIPTARFRVADSVAEALAVLRGGEFGPASDPVVIKADGLAAGKGVVVARSRAEGERAVVEELMNGERIAAQRVVIEEALAGREASLLLWTDGRDYVLMPPARDHKRAGENDTGPNTGGMGAITSPEVLDQGAMDRIVREIVEPTLDGARADGLDFRGVLFIGLMLTADGPRVLEYNVRFGDPEAQAILVRLRSNLAELYEAVARRCVGQQQVAWSEDASACVVLAARGYPERPETGAPIEGLDIVARKLPDVKIFHAGTSRADDGSWRTAGGRVLGITASGASLDTALGRCYDAIAHIAWDGMHYRRDIGRFAAGGESRAAGGGDVP